MPSGPTSANPPEASHSRAYESLVREPDDIVGFLAYALYKKNIHERRRAGKNAPTWDQRDPSDTEVSVYRSRAEDYLRAFAQQAIEAEKSDILAEGVNIRADEIKREVRRSTGFWWPGVAVGIVSWFISVVITVFIAIAAPSWVADLVRLIGRAK